MKIRRLTRDEGTLGEEWERVHGAEIGKNDGKEGQAQVVANVAGGDL